MNWIRGTDGPYIRTEDGRFYICKAAGVYTLSDNSVLVCSERGEGALERCKAKAEELAK